LPKDPSFEIGFIDFSQNGLNFNPQKSSKKYPNRIRDIGPKKPTR
jgi:hypothetical protein